MDKEIQVSKTINQQKYDADANAEVNFSIALDNTLFQPKNMDIFLFLHKNIHCGYSLDVPRRGTSNEYPQYMFLSRNKKHIYLIPPIFWMPEGLLLIAIQYFGMVRLIKLAKCLVTFWSEIFMTLKIEQTGNIPFKNNIIANMFVYTSFLAIGDWRVILI